MRNRTNALVMMALLTCCTVSGAFAQRCGKNLCLTPIDIGQGPRLIAAEPSAYWFSARFAFELGSGESARVRGGPVVSGHYDGQDWRAAVGGRFGWKVLGPADFRYGLLVQAEALYGGKNSAPASLGLVAEIPFVRLGIRPIRDLVLWQTVLEASIGTDIRSLLAYLST